MRAREIHGLCAGRTGQVLNASSLGNDAGVTHATARRRLSILETSFVAYLLRHDPLLGELVPAVVYGGNDSHRRSGGAAVAWSGIASWLEECLGQEHEDQVFPHHT